MRPPTDPDLAVVATLTHRNDAFLAKSTLAKLPEGYGMADIPWLAWAPPFEALPPNPQLEAMIPGFRPVFTSDNYLVLLRAAELGIGAIFLGTHRHRFSRATNLVPLGLELGPHATSELHLVAARSALDISRVRIVAELLKAELEA
jgi:DNA-binding transcriptional LysR family regulator